jgi:hypothetical protein
MALRWRKEPPVGLELQRGERVLAHAATPDGGVVAATDKALFLPADEGFLRIPWERVEQAGWRHGTLHVNDVGGHAYEIPLRDAGSVPETVRERVTATIVVSTQVQLNGGKLRIVCRRAPGGDLRWSLVFDKGLDPDDPAVRAEARRHLEEFRGQTGL